MMELLKEDIDRVVRRLPKDVRELLTSHPGILFVGGGFIRAVVAGEEISDIDVFGTDKASLSSAAKQIQRDRGGEAECRLHHSKNAITTICINRLPLQFIHRWVFPTAEDVCRSFDFTVCQAVIWREGSAKDSPWRSVASPRFYTDLAARRLVYTAPVRDEEAGGSLLRAIKYIKRGYNIQVESLAGLVSRLVAALDPAKVNTKDSDRVTFVLRGLLREVDPRIAIDGLDVIDDHEAPDTTVLTLLTDAAGAP